MTCTFPSPGYCKIFFLSGTRLSICMHLSRPWFAFLAYMMHVFAGRYPSSPTSLMNFPCIVCAFLGSQSSTVLDPLYSSCALRRRGPKRVRDRQSTERMSGFSSFPTCVCMCNVFSLLLFLLMPPSRGRVVFFSLSPNPIHVIMVGADGTEMLRGLYAWGIGPRI